MLVQNLPDNKFKSGKPKIYYSLIPALRLLKKGSKQKMLPAIFMMVKKVANFIKTLLKLKIFLYEHPSAY